MVSYSNFSFVDKHVIIATPVNGGYTGYGKIFIFMAIILILSSFMYHTIFTTAQTSSGSGYTHVENEINILKEIRVKNVNRIIIGALNINSLSGKIEQLKVIIGNYLDVLIIGETKLDPSFPTDQFLIPGYCKPYRLDRNRNGGGLVIYIREDIPAKNSISITSQKISKECLLK